MCLARRACSLYNINSDELEVDETASINSNASDEGGVASINSNTSDEGGVASVSINSNASDEGGVASVSINSNASDEGGVSINSNANRPTQAHISLSDQYNPLIEQHSMHHGIKSLLSAIVSYF